MVECRQPPLPTISRRPDPRDLDSSPRWARLPSHSAGPTWQVAARRPATPAATASAVSHRAASERFSRRGPGLQLGASGTNRRSAETPVKVGRRPFCTSCMSRPRTARLTTNSRSVVAQTCAKSSRLPSCANCRKPDRTLVARAARAKLQRSIHPLQPCPRTSPGKVAGVRW